MSMQRINRIAALRPQQTTVVRAVVMLESIHLQLSRRDAALRIRPWPVHTDRRRSALEIDLALSLALSILVRSVSSTFVDQSA